MSVGVAKKLASIPRSQCHICHRKRNYYNPLDKCHTCQEKTCFDHLTIGKGKSVGLDFCDTCLPK